jgi:hypothetical protein
MSFNGQPNMGFWQDYSCTCDLHLKLNIVNPLNESKHDKRYLKSSPKKI